MNWREMQHVLSKPLIMGFPMKFRFPGPAPAASRVPFMDPAIGSSRAGCGSLTRFGHLGPTEAGERQAPRAGARPPFLS